MTPEHPTQPSERAPRDGGDPLTDHVTGAVVGAERHGDASYGRGAALGGLPCSRLTWVQPEDLLGHALRQARLDGREPAAIEARRRAADGPDAPEQAGASASRAAGDFGGSVCRAVSGGWDTDSGGATAGSIAGLLAGTPDALPDHWRAPLKNRLATTVADFDGTGSDTLAHLTRLEATRP